MTTKELKEKAKELKIKNWWNLKKDELISSIQNVQNDVELANVDTSLPTEESESESENEASVEYVASVRNKETKEIEVVRGQYSNRTEFYVWLRANGYTVRYVSTEKNFEIDGKKYRKACDKVKADRKAARKAKKEAMKMKITNDFAKELLRYGEILADDQNENENVRVYEIRYNDKLYLLEMKNGEYTNIEEL